MPGPDPTFPEPNVNQERICGSAGIPGTGKAEKQREVRSEQLQKYNSALVPGQD